MIAHHEHSHFLLIQHIMKSVYQYLISFLLIVISVHHAQGQQVFTSLDSLLYYTNTRSSTIKSGEIKFSQAQKAKLAAIAGVIDLNGNVSFNLTNNITLPVSLFPAEAFGGETGTYREVQTGIPYTNTLNQNVELKLLNTSGWQNLKLSKINIDATITDNKLSKKSLFENIAVTYYNILTLQEQLASCQKNVAASDTLYHMVKHKQELGLAKQQDVNDAQVNQINSQENVNQITFLIQQQYIALKILCDISESETIILKQPITYGLHGIKPTVSFNKLSTINSQLKEQSALAYYRQLKLSNLPYLSAFASNSNQQFSSTFSLFDNNVKWINSNYIGLKAVWIIPSATSLTQLSKSKYDYLLAKQNTAHNELKSQLEFKQLVVDYDKAESQMNTNKQVYELRADTYRKNLENYRFGLISLDILLNSYNAMITSEYNYISATVSVMLAQSKITINNQLQ